MKTIIASLMLFMCSAGAVMAQGVSPVDRLRNYNGTYTGSPYSGSIGYSTLYRDNQDNGLKSGCRGEGCGRHPGVDIAVASGTSVKASFSGLVVISRCDSAWGGLVVIKTNHPQRYWESIYVTYAHLKARSVSVGQYVSAGSILGKSGGGSSDPCRGSSSGAHLHFQIDKDDGNLEPYYPSSSLLNVSDSSFYVAAKTYNPIVMVQGGYKWNFSQSGNRELWDIFNWQNWGVSDGALWLDGGNDPYIQRGGLTNCGLSKPCSSSVLAEAQDHSSVYLDLYNSCYSSSGKIYFTTSIENYWDESKIVYYYPGDSGSFRGVIGMSWHPKWRGYITGLRIDPAENCSPYNFDPTYFGEIKLSN